MPQIGDFAPDFTLKNQDDQSVHLRDNRGKKVVIFAFPKAGTPGCTLQACNFNDVMPRLAHSNTVVYGISTDTPPELKRFKQTEKLNYDLLSDPERNVIEAWDAWGPSLLGLVRVPAIIRSYWVIDEEGRFIDLKIGAGPRESMEKALQAIEKHSRLRRKI